MTLTRYYFEAADALADIEEMENESWSVRQIVALRCQDNGEPQLLNDRPTGFESHQLFVVYEREGP